ncbi:phosphate ABC transporter substrate-binding protein [Thiohalorhabdus methylotrophus]|uniref:Phosphate ABC transporter substrate-binding protein n=1 Tax=Thiohalorhabdus methylotrophus TaxID=3242694 RepID=A0ABV4TR63_9GAMM
MQSLLRPILGLFILSAAIMAVSPAPAKTLEWGGCGITKKAFMRALAGAFQEKTGTRIHIQGGGATYGIRGVHEGELDLGGSCRPALANDEREDVRMVQLAWDALVVIVHPSNPVNDLSGGELEKVFRGEITNWKQLGGPDKFIIIGYRSLPLSGVGYSFRELGFRESTGAGDFARGLARKSSGPLEMAVEHVPDAIAVTGVSSARKRDVKIIGVDGKAASAENIANGDYPLYRPLYLTVPRDPEPAVQRFLDFALSDEGQRIIAEQGTVNLEMGRNLDNPWGGDYIEPPQ